MDTPHRSPLVMVGSVAVAGAVIIGAMRVFREPLLEWVIANPSQTAARVTMVIAIIGAVFVVPLLAFAAYAWSVAAKMDEARGRGLKVLSALLVVGAVALAAVLWRLDVLMTR